MDPTERRAENSLLYTMLQKGQALIMFMGENDILKQAREVEIFISKLKLSVV